LAAGADCARRLLAAGLIEGAVLRLKGETLLVGTRSLRAHRRHEELIQA
jgi:Fe2+ transport system protein FeoA